MKTLKTIAVAVTLLIGTTLFANNELTDKRDLTPTVTQEIGDLLEDPSFKVEKEVMAYATFMLNDNNEIVVLSVDTEDETVEKFVKSRLNYQKLENSLKEGKQYQVPIKIVAG